jgi:hypothetical protein
MQGVDHDVGADMESCRPLSPLRPELLQPFFRNNALTPQLDSENAQFSSSFAYQKERARTPHYSVNLKNYKLYTHANSISNHLTWQRDYFVYVEENFWPIKPAASVPIMRA